METAKSVNTNNKSTREMKNNTIATFLGWSGEYYTINPNTEERICNGDEPFDTDWNWLMPVVLKISERVQLKHARNECEDIVYWKNVVDRTVTGIAFPDGKTHIEATRDAVYQFILANLAHTVTLFSNATDVFDADFYNEHDGFPTVLITKGNKTLKQQRGSVEGLVKHLKEKYPSWKIVKSTF